MKKRIIKKQKRLSQMPSGQFSDRFVEHMRAQSLHAFYRYGATADNAASVDFGREAAHRLEEYERTGNTEFLVDVVVFAMCEFMHPHVEGARYEPNAQETKLVSGTASRQLKERFYRHEGD